MRRWLLIAASTTLLSCSTRNEATGSSTLAGPTLGARDVLRALPGISARLDLGGPLVLSDGRARLRRNSRWSQLGDVEVTLPATADGVLRVEGTGKEVWLSVRALDARPVPGAVEARSLVFAGAGVDTDIVHVVATDRVEEFRLLRTPRAATSARYALRHGAGISSFRLSAGRVEAIDAQGSVLLRSEPAWAVDADGVRRDLTLTLQHGAEEDVLATALDTKGLRFPIAVDPAWTAGPTDALAKRTQAATVSDGANTYLLGGSSDGTDTLSTCAYFDGTKFVPMPSLPTPRKGGIAAWLPGASGRVLIVAGGSNGATALTTVETWTTGAPAWATSTYKLTSARLRAVALPTGSNAIVLFGGNDGTTTLSTAEQINNTGSDADSNGIVDVNVTPYATSMLTPRESAMAWVQGGRTYVAGGVNGATTLSTVEQYSGSGSFVPASPLLGPRANAVNLGAFGVGVLVGGTDGTNALSTMELLDASTGLWKAGPTMSARRLGPVAAVVSATGGAAGTVLLVLGGGFDGTSALSSSELLEFKLSGTPSGVFRDGGPMPGPRAASFACTIGVGTVNPSFLAAGGISGTFAAPTVLSTTAKYTVLAKGAACTDSLECESGFCADGTCCDTACTEQCFACNLGSAKGMCAPVTGAPVGTRTACDGTGAGTVCGKVCNGLDAVCKYPTVTIGCGVNSCLAGVEKHVSVCDGAGSCSDVPKTCGAYICGATACKSTCTGDGDCTAAYYCVAGNCLPKPGLGAPCSGTTPCSSGFFCVEGVCCNTACTGQCASCTVSGKIGTCTPVKGDPVGGRTACGDGGTEICKAATCDGIDATKCAGFKYDAAKVCAAAKCSSDKTIGESHCDGGGACLGPGATDCAGGFVCSGTACKTKCTSGADCVAGLQCKSGFCVPLDGPGTPCAGAESCASGFCSDSVCCDKPCGGQCESCTEPGKFGVCTTVSGDPRGARAACDSGGTDVCKARKCDAKDGAKCAGYANDSSKTCADPKCDSGNAVGESKCDGSGACVAPAPKSCAPYACSGKTCRVDCATTADCAPGNECAGGACRPGSSATCSADGLTSTSKDGTKKECRPYRCKTDGTCDDKCSTSSDCQTGFACDVASKICIEQAAAPTGDSGGCAMGSSSSLSGLAGVAAVLAGLGARRRRR